MRFNRNRSTYLSAVQRDGVYVISVHLAFSEASEKIWNRLAQFYRRASKQVRFDLEQYIHNLSPELCQSYARKAPVLPAEGEFYDLNEVLLRTVALGFDNSYPGELPRIGWSPITRGRYVSRLGSYDIDSNSISISSRLDDKDLPLDFLAAVVFHELRCPCAPAMADSRCHMWVPERIG